MRYLVVKDSTVFNVVEWDGISEFAIPEGYELIQSDYAGIDWVFDSNQNKFINPADLIPIPEEGRKRLPD